MISLTEVCRITISPEDDILLLVEEGIVTPEKHLQGKLEFQDQDLVLIKKACRLHRELKLDWHAVALMMELLEQRDRLTSENRALKIRLERFI
jgi:chaperone modulatory protein CbpM